MVKDYQDLQCLEAADESHKNEKGLPLNIMNFPRSSNNSCVLFGLFALCAISILILIIMVATNNSNTKQTQKKQQEDFSNFTQAVKSRFQILNSEGEVDKEKIKKMDSALEKIQTDKSKEELNKQLEELKGIINSLKCDMQILKSNGSQTTCCPSEWLTFSGNCYYLSTEGKPWDDSRKYCIAEDAHLVVINTQAEQEYLQKKTTPQYYWLGLTDIDGTWKWIDGTNYEITPKNWIPGQPDEYYGHGLGGGEDCAHFHRDGRWNDDHCSRQYQFICEKEMN